MYRNLNCLMKQQGLVQYFQTAKKKVLRKLIALQRQLISHKIIKVGENLKRTFKEKTHFYITSEKESTKTTTTTEVAEKECDIKVKFI